MGKSEAMRDFVVECGRRSLRNWYQQPLTTSLTLLVLAIGLGACLAMSSLFEQAVNRPLHPALESVALLRWAAERPLDRTILTSAQGYSSRLSSASFPREMWAAVQRPESGFDQAFAFVPMGLGLETTTVVANGQVALATVVMVSGAFFDTLGIGPSIGVIDDELADNTAIISERYWTRVFGRSPAALGAAILVNGLNYQIAGVAEPGFTGLEPGVPTDLWIPLLESNRLTAWGGPSTALSRPRVWSMMLGGRVAAGDPAVALSRLEQTFTAVMRAAGATTPPAVKLQLVPASQGVSQRLARVESPIVTLTAFSLVLLLVAAANLVALRAGRSEEQGREWMIRLALGASRRHLMLEVLSENLLLGLGGFMLGIGIAQWLGVGAVALLDQTLTARGMSLEPFALDWRLVVWSAFAVIGLAIGGTLLQLYQRRGPQANILGHPARGITPPGRAPIQTLSLVGQVAILLVLLSVAWTCIDSFRRLDIRQLGVDLDGLLLVEFRTSSAGSLSAAAAQSLGELEARIAAFPVVDAVASSAFGFLAETAANMPVAWRDGESLPGVETVAVNFVGPGFAKAYGAMFTEGRDILESDQGSGPVAVIVNEAFARRVSSNGSAIGREVTFTSFSKPGTIVGVVKDWRFLSLAQEVPPQVFAARRQMPRVAGMGTIHMAVRHRGEPATLLTALRGLTASLDGQLVLRRGVTAREAVARARGRETLVMNTSIVAALLTLVVAIVGLAACLILTVSRRRAEIAVRLALGAGRWRISSLLIGYCVRITATAAIVGVPLAWAAIRALSQGVSEVQPPDPRIVLSTMGVVLLVSLLSCTVAVRRIVAIDPATVLRDS